MKKLFLCKNIITMENAQPDGKSSPNAVLVENGVVLKVGQAEEIKSEFPDCEVINLGENTLMPSFIDPHSHFTQTAFALLQVFLDGSPQGKTAWMRTPYKGTEDYFGYPTMDDEDVIFAFETAARENLQIIAHCNGDAAAGQFLRCLEIAEKKHSNLKDLRPVMIHAQLIGIDQLQKAFELGVILSFFVAHVYHWGDVHIENFGKKRAEVISPAASAQNKGIVYTFHQDSPVIEPDMLETIWCAVNRITKNGVALGKEECVSIYDALKAVTLNAAYQYGEENDKGSISEGKKADFVVLSENPLETDKTKIREIKVLKTFKEGNLIFHIDN